MLHACMCRGSLLVVIPMSYRSSRVLGQPTHSTHSCHSLHALYTRIWGLFCTNIHLGADSLLWSQWTVSLHYRIQQAEVVYQVPYTMAAHHSVWSARAAWVYTALFTWPHRIFSTFRSPSTGKDTIPKTLQHSWTGLVEFKFDERPT